MVLWSKRFWSSVFLAWLVIIGIDFFFHASLLASIWKQELTAVKPLDELALLIPFGYLSFLLLTILIGYLFAHVFKEKPPLKEAIKFAIIFGGLFSLSSFLGQFSFLNLPAVFLAFISAVYFFEIFAALMVFQDILFAKSIRKKILPVVSIFVILLLLGVIIQNIA
jgi:hypothetical protein